MREDECLCSVTGQLHVEGECHWWDAERVSGPDIGGSFLWYVTVDDDGIAWTWCAE